MGRNLGGLCPLFGRGSWVPIQHSVAWADAYLHSILIHPAVWAQQTWAENWVEALPPFGEGELGLHLTQRRLGRGLPLYQVAS